MKKRMKRRIAVVCALLTVLAAYFVVVFVMDPCDERYWEVKRLCWRDEDTQELDACRATRLDSRTAWLTGEYDGGCSELTLSHLSCCDHAQAEEGKCRRRLLYWWLPD